MLVYIKGLAKCLGNTTYVHLLLCPQMAPTVKDKGNTLDTRHSQSLGTTMHLLSLSCLLSPFPALSLGSVFSSVYGACWTSLSGSFQLESSSLVLHCFRGLLHSLSNQLVPNCEQWPDDSNCSTKTTQQFLKQGTGFLIPFLALLTTEVQELSSLNFPFSHLLYLPLHLSVFNL